MATEAEHPPRTRLASDTVPVGVSGSCDVRSWAEDLRSVRVAGWGDIRYTGSPRVEQRISGVASVLRVPQIVI